MIVSSDPIKFKPTFKPELTTKLNSILNNFNSCMTSMKKEWATSVMHYNQTSSFAYEHRFRNIQRKNGRQTADGSEEEFTTAEQETGSFIVPPLVKAKVDQYLQEFQMRDYTCSVSSFANDEYNYLTQFLIKQSFDNPEFRSALTSAFKDALLKKVGFIRPRVYSINKDTVIPMIENEDGKITNFFYKSKPMKNGLVIEYVDVENVYYNPAYNNLQEFFISTPTSYSELVSNYPHLLPMLNPSYEISSDILSKYTNYYEKNKVKTLNKQCLRNWKNGEMFSKWYYRPEMFKDVMQGSKMNKERDQIISNTGFAGSNNDLTSLLGNNFDQNWDKYFFGKGYDNFLNNYFSDNSLYRVNEYYNLATNKYILYIDDHVLYDGSILEPFNMDCPLQPIYFDHAESMGVAGKSVNDHIHSLQVDASLMATRSKQILEASSLTFIEVNSDRLDAPDTPIDVNIINFIRTSGAELGNNMPALQQLQIQNPGLQLYPQYESKIFQDVERIFPSTEPISSQLTKEEKEQIISSRNLRTDFFLRYNGNQLTKFAYKVFSIKLFELMMSNSSELVIDLGIKGDIGLVIRRGEDQIIIAKKQINDILLEQYNKQLDNAKGQISQSPEFQAQLAALNENLIATTQKDMQNPDVAEQLKNPEEQQKYTEIQKGIQAKSAEKLLNDLASQTVPNPVDKNWYLNFEQITDLQQSRKQFNFSFKETEAERRKKTAEFISLMNQMPLTEFAIDYSKFSKELAIAYNFNPNVILQEVAPATELNSIKNNRTTTYFDMQKNVALTTPIAEKIFGIKSDEIKFDQESAVVKGLLFMEEIKKQGEVDIIKAKVLTETKANIISDQNKQINQNSTTNQSTTP